MALMYPTSLPDDVASAAERRLFGLFQAQLPDDFVVLHSVKWLVRERRFDRDGEADFLIVHPDLGILVLEVKGGGVRVDDQSGLEPLFQQRLHHCVGGFGGVGSRDVDQRIPWVGLRQRVAHAVDMPRGELDADPRHQLEPGQRRAAEV